MIHIACVYGRCIIYNKWLTVIDVAYWLYYASIPHRSSVLRICLLQWRMTGQYTLGCLQWSLLMASAWGFLWFHILGIYTVWMYIRMCEALIYHWMHFQCVETYRHCGIYVHMLCMSLPIDHFTLPVMCLLADGTRRRYPNWDLRTLVFVKSPNTGHSLLRCTPQRHNFW